MRRTRSPRGLLERALELPQEAALLLPWPPNGRIVVRGVFGFLKQVSRSRALRLSSSSVGRARRFG